MDYYLGQIMMFIGNYAPADWMVCNGALLNISEYQELYSLIGMTYGGDGATKFAIPDMQGRILVGKGTSPVSGNSFVLGAKGGVSSYAPTVANMPAHTHALKASPDQATTNDPTNAMLAAVASPLIYYMNPPASGYSVVSATMGPASISAAGSTTTFDMHMPSLPMTFCICCRGLYPSQS